MARQLERKIDVANLQRELADNKQDVLEVLREALSNAKDHRATRVWIRTEREARGTFNLVVVDDGDGMSDEGMQAFWGVGASHKPYKSIGYKGHGTKLFFDCARLSVATKTSADTEWQLSTVDDPAKVAARHIEVTNLPTGSRLSTELGALGTTLVTGTIVLVEGVQGRSAEGLLERKKVESYCDWSTVLGDIRSGLFDRREDFHKAIAENATSELRPGDAELRPIRVLLRLNGERSYTEPGGGPQPQHKHFMEAWRAGVVDGVPLAFGHRFADEFKSPTGAKRVQDDSTALRLTGPEDWVFEKYGFTVVARVEGHRRQREAYPEASWQNHPGVFKFEDRFGLWLCRDFVPIVRRPDLLLNAINEVSRKRKSRFEFKSVRNWHVFVNHQGYTPTANRDGISNQQQFEADLLLTLQEVIERAFKKPGFQEWVQRLQSARMSAHREREVDHMNERRLEVQSWYGSSDRRGAVDVSSIRGVSRRPGEDSLIVREPASEQELFHLFGMMEAMFDLPLRVLEYDANEGVDAIALVNDQRLHGATYARVEFKYQVASGLPLDHFFDAIDLVVCWQVGGTGDLFELTGAKNARLRMRATSVLNPAVDTHEIFVDGPDGGRVIPVLQVRKYFEAERPLVTRRARKR